MPAMDLVTALSQDPEPLPEWLKQPETSPFDRENFFGQRTVYYPGWGNDGEPVRVCAQSHAAHTFIYVDYGVSMSVIRDRLHGIGDHGFRGYRAGKPDELTESILHPSGWTRHVHPFELPEDRDRFVTIEPFYLYVVLKRDDDYDESHGPERLALLFVGGDGHATYDALFCQDDNTPAPFLVVVQDHGQGGNYCRFERGGLLEGIAAECNVYPELLLVGSVDVCGHNYKPWDGYANTGVMPEPQGTAGNPRKLYRRDGDCLDKARGRAKRLLLLEMHDILNDCGDGGMRMKDIADLVNKRDPYGIRDRSPVTFDDVYEIWSKHKHSGLLERKKKGGRLRWTG